MKEKEQYLDTLPEKEREVLLQFSQAILKYDPAVTEVVGKVMTVSPALTYNEDDVFKYGLAVTKSHISFHSLILYIYPDLMEALKAKLTTAKFQKSCVNFKSLEDFPLTVFKEHLKASAKADFSPMIQHYKSKKK